MPGPAPLEPWSAREGAAAVYLPACANRIFGNPREQPARPSLPEALLTVSARAGMPLWVPDDVAGTCCGTPWSSKGYRRGHEWMARRVAESAIRWTDGGALPLVIDASSCAHGLLSEVPGALEGALAQDFAKVEVLDSIAWVDDSLLPGLRIETRVSSVLLHPPCAAAQLGLTERLTRIAEALADEVLTGTNPTCRGRRAIEDCFTPSCRPPRWAPPQRSSPAPHPAQCRAGNPHLRDRSL